MFCQLAAALGRLVDHPGDGLEFGAIGDRFGQDFDGAGDHRQDVVEVVGDAAGQLADRFHLLGLAELGFRGLLFRQVPADEEMPPHRLRPVSHPGQRHRVPVLVEVAGLEIAHLPAAPRQPHFVARAVEIVGMDEFDRGVPDHFRGLIAQDGHRAGADLDEGSLGVGYQDQVLRGLEDAPPLLDLLAQRPLGAFARGDVARDRGGSHHLAGRGLDRRDHQRDVPPAAILVQAHGVVMFDGFAPGDLGAQRTLLDAYLGRIDDVDVIADRLRRGESRQPFGGLVPARDGAVQRHENDGIVGGFDHRAEQPLAFAVLFPFGSRLAAQLCEQAGQLGLKCDVVEQQHGEHEGRGAEAVDPPGIEAEIVSRNVDHRRQCDVEQPRAQHHHQPDVDQRMWPPQPKHQ